MAKSHIYRFRKEIGYPLLAKCLEITKRREAEAGPTSSATRSRGASSHRTPAQTQTQTGAAASGTAAAAAPASTGRRSRRLRGEHVDLVPLEALDLLKVRRRASVENGNADSKGGGDNKDDEQSSAGAGGGTVDVGADEEADAVRSGDAAGDAGGDVDGDVDGNGNGEASGEARGEASGEVSGGTNGDAVDAGGTEDDAAMEKVVGTTQQQEATDENGDTVEGMDVVMVPTDATTTDTGAAAAVSAPPQQADVDTVTRQAGDSGDAVTNSGAAALHSGAAATALDSGAAATAGAEEAPSAGTDNDTSMPPAVDDGPSTGASGTAAESDVVLVEESDKDDEGTAIAVPNVDNAEDVAQSLKELEQFEAEDEEAVQALGA